MKGIILSGGLGTRLHPITFTTSKQLLPVFDKPMIYYPLSTLIHAGVNELLIISTPEDLERYERLLGSGDDFGISIQYKIQKNPSGLPNAISIAKDFIANESFWMILGDNLFHGPNFGRELTKIQSSKGATVFAYHVQDPRSYGVINFRKDTEEIERIEEKPLNPSSNWIIPGLYHFDSSAVFRSNKLAVSKRGEFEIIDLLNLYLEDSMLEVKKVSRGNAWFDLGTPVSIMNAGNFVKTIQETQGLMIGSPEEAALHAGFLEFNDLINRLEPKRSSTYYSFLLNSLIRIN